MLIRDPEFRASVTEICRTLEISLSTVNRRLRPVVKTVGDDNKNSVNAAKLLQDEDILRRCIEIRLKHPFWGYRRTWANIRFRQGIAISRNRVCRIMREHGLLLDRKKTKPARPFRPKIKATMPNEIWGTDMSKFLIPGIGWISFVIVIDWFTKMILGMAIGRRGDTGLWLNALNKATIKAFPEDGVRGKNVKLISDNGSQPTSKRYMAECRHLEIEQIFTTYDNPKGNADTERMIRTVKEEAIWPYEHETIAESEIKLRETIEFYNTEYCHSSLSYMSPMEYKESFFNNLRLAA